MTLNHILEVRRVDPRGPAFLGDLITSGLCGPYDSVLHTVNVDLAPYKPPAEPIRVLLYINGKYAGFATLGPDGFVQGEGQHSPWMALETLLS